MFAFICDSLLDFYELQRSCSIERFCEYLSSLSYLSWVCLFMSRFGSLWLIYRSSLLFVCLSGFDLFLYFCILATEGVNVSHWPNGALTSTCVCHIFLPFLIAIVPTISNSASTSSYTLYWVSVINAWLICSMIFPVSPLTSLQSSYKTLSISAILRGPNTATRNVDTLLLKLRMFSLRSGRHFTVVIW